MPRETQSNVSSFLNRVRGFYPAPLIVTDTSLTEVSIDVLGDIHAYRFDGSGGERVLVRLDPLQAMEARLELFGPSDTLLVNRADRHGLAQLYQLRGRVGRGHEASVKCLARFDRAEHSALVPEDGDDEHERAPHAEGHVDASRDPEKRADPEKTRQDKVIDKNGAYQNDKQISHDPYLENWSDQWL